MQESDLALRIWSCAEIILELSHCYDLAPGDLIVGIPQVKKFGDVDLQGVRNAGENRRRRVTDPTFNPAEIPPVKPPVRSKILLSDGTFLAQPP